MPPAFSSLQHMVYPDGHPLAVAAALAARLAETAAARDRAGGHAAEERAWIRDSGLLTLSIPAACGGQESDWPTVYQAIRILATADSALAHVFAFHHLQMITIRLYGSAEQQRRLMTDTVERRLFWGNALNPLDRRAKAVPDGDGYTVDGIKSFSSGSVGSDWMVMSAWDEAAKGAVISAVPTATAGVRVEPDWDAFGQRQTDSGNVHFSQLRLAPELILQRPGAAVTAQATLRSQAAQLILANLYLGIGLGAFEAARRYTAEEARPWMASGVTRAADDPLLQHRYGELWLLLPPAELTTDRAAAELDLALAKGNAVTAAERGQVAVAVATAKCLAHRAGLEISSQMFELMGARATSQRYGFDRFWRNARVHTLHDPIDYKLRDLGRYALDGALPEPSPYS